MTRNDHLPRGKKFSFQGFRCHGTVDLEGKHSAFCFHVFDRFDIGVGWRSFSRILQELEIPKNGIIIPQKDIHNIENIENTSKHHLYSSFIDTAVHPIHDERASCTSWNR